jgi:hypothetical protein
MPLTIEAFLALCFTASQATCTLTALKPIYSLNAVADCWSMPHLLHVVVAVLSLVVFVAMAALFAVGEMELDFTTTNRLAMMHTG